MFPPRSSLARLVALVLGAVIAGTAAAQPPAAKPAEEAAKPDIRLGTEVVPTRQEVALTVDADQTDYRGSTTIALDVRASVTSFRLHAEGITLGRIELVQGEQRQPVTASAPTNDGTLTLTVAAPLAVGPARLELDFERPFETRAVGLYRLETGGAAYTFTQFEAVDARKAFPCFDEPSFKIPFQLTLTVPAAHLAVSNTPEEAVTANADGSRTVRFATTKPLPTYLVAIATGPLETRDIPDLGFPGRVVAPRGQIGMAGTAIAMTPPIVRALESYFGSPYPYEKLDLIAVPEYWYGAMENAGAITFKDDILLVDEKTLSFAQRRRLAGILAHEVAHHWYGNLVTMAWWDDLWLNEAFAYWMDTKIPQNVFPELVLATEGVGGRQRAMAIDSQAVTHAVRQPVTDLVNLAEASGALTNQKGEAVLRMTEAWIGEEAFRDGVRAYMREHAWGNAEAKDLFAALGKASGHDVAAVMSSFLDQPGVPLVSAELLPPSAAGSPARVRLRQRRFIADGEIGLGADPDQRWRIPMILRYPTADGVRRQPVLLTSGEAVIALDTTTAPAWIHPNDGELGYYRWQVADAVLDTLLADATTLLGEAERAALMGHLGALFREGLVSGDRYLGAISRFATDPAPAVVDVAAGAVERVYGTFWTPELEPALAAWVRTTFGPALDRFGIQPTAGEAEVVSLLRPDLIALLADLGQHPGARAAVAAIASQALDAPASVDPEIAEAALVLHAQTADATYFERLTQLFAAAPTTAERERYLAALGGFRDPALLDKALAFSLGGGLRPQELATIPRVAAGDPRTTDRVFDWMMTNYDAIGQRIPPMFMAFMPFFAGGCSEQRLDKATAFFAQPGHNPMGTDAQLAKVAIEVHACLALRRHAEPGVRAYLGTPGSSPG